VAVAAASAAGADLVGVDLMSRVDSGYVVIELNGAADFDPGYVIGGAIYAAVADALRLPIPAPRAGSLSPLLAPID
jgi:glutathione synthase/RimK-type ligase-like ATP-grasp enzyme